MPVVVHFLTSVALAGLRPQLILYGGRPAAPPATSMGTAKPMPMKTSSEVGLTRPVDDADDTAVAVHQRTAGVAGIDRRIDLDQALQQGAAIRLLEVRPRPDTTPALSDPVRPNGFPTTKASLPTRTASGLPSVAGTRSAGGCDAPAAPRCPGPGRASDRGWRCRAVGEGELDGSRVGHDVEAGQDVAVGVDDDPAAEAPIGDRSPRRPATVRTSTSDGRTAA